MKILLNLSEETLLKFQALAKEDNRSRKQCMEMVLNDYKKNSQSIVEKRGNESKHYQNYSEEKPLMDGYSEKIKNASDAETLLTIASEIDKDKNLRGPDRANLNQKCKDKGREF